MEIATPTNDAISKKERRMLLGFELHWWEDAMVVSLCVAGIAALIVGVLTWGVVRLTREEARESKELVAKANERAAMAQLETERIKEKLAPRALSEEQKSALTSALKGKLPRVFVVVQRDLEAQAFALQLEIALQAAGAILHPQELPPGEPLYVPAGVMMYRPGGATSEDDMKDDPLYIALKKAKLFGGFTAGPVASLKFGPMGPQLDPRVHILYVGQKSPY
jgi:hypothetical protein